MNIYIYIHTADWSNFCRWSLLTSWQLSLKRFSAASTSQRVSPWNCCRKTTKPTWATKKYPGELIAIRDFTTWFTHCRESYQPTSIMRWENGVLLMAHMFNMERSLNMALIQVVSRTFVLLVLSIPIVDRWWSMNLKLVNPKHMSGSFYVHLLWLWSDLILRPVSSTDWADRLMIFRIWHHEVTTLWVIQWLAPEILSRHYWASLRSPKWICKLRIPAFLIYNIYKVVPIFFVAL